MRVIHRYTKEEEQWLVDNIKKYNSIKDMYNDFRKVFNIKLSYMSFMGKKSNMRLKKSSYYTEEQDKYLKELIKQQKTYSEILELFNGKFNDNRTKDGIIAHCCRFIKNKNYIPNKQRFLKQCPVGTIREFSSGTKNRKPRIMIKIKMIPAELLGKQTYYNKEYWIPYARYVYENHYGYKLKENEVICHLDGDYKNNNIDNLILGDIGSIGYANSKLYRGEKPRPETKTDSEKKVALILGCLNYEMLKNKRGIK